MIDSQAHIRIARPSLDLAADLGRTPDEALVARLVEHGGTRTPAHNPYWDEYGVTVTDPDGYQLVLLLPHLGLSARYTRAGRQRRT
ncbi:hypothetical protein ACFXDJ_27005 [Streptomyces sp. NPDC059443]|uniref:hypothetical protein n=1 Tax=unclassified Streptomyces TaxID=2593676 RepID=UPI0036BFCEB5